MTAQQISKTAEWGKHKGRETGATRDTNRENQLKSGESYIKKQILSQDSKLRRTSHTEHQADWSQSHCACWSNKQSLTYLKYWQMASGA